VEVTTGDCNLTRQGHLQKTTTTHYSISNQQNRETIAATSASITQTCCQLTRAKRVRPAFESQTRPTRLAIQNPLEVADR